MDNDDDGGGGVDNPQRRLQTMGRGSDGGGWWRRLSATCGCGDGRLRLGEAAGQGRQRGQVYLGLCVFCPIRALE